MPFDTLVHPDEVSATAVAPLTVFVRMPDGGVLSPSVKVGERIMDALAAFGLPFRQGFGADGAARLLGHLVMTPELDGLEIELPWDALVPQTYWVAG
jgi:hypothetical protein